MSSDGTDGNDQGTMIRTAMVAIAERIADQALSGQCHGLVVLELGPEGLVSHFAGLAPMAVVGMLEMSKDQLKTAMVEGTLQIGTFQGPGPWQPIKGK